MTDKEYEKQLKVYKNFVTTTFNKEVNTYLYSLIDRIYKKCE